MATMSPPTATGAAGRPCALCGGATAPWVRARDRTGGGPRWIGRCRTCGVGRTTDAPAPRGPSGQGGATAAARRAPGAAPARDGRGAGGVLARRVARRQVRRLLAALPAHATVLDVGAGSGLRTRVLAAAGHRVIAIEPDGEEAARLRAAAPAGVVVREGGVPGAIGRGEADGALLWHVLEHVDDPRAALRALATALRPGAPLLVAVPNPVGAEARLFGGRWHGWEPARHRWHLPPSVLADLMRQAGFTGVRVAATGGWEYPASLAFSLAPALDPQVHPATPARRAAALASTALLAPVALAARLAGAGAQVVGWARAPGADRDPGDGGSPVA
ncbi:MAG TPA: class I SAM-dependent methyltransferase [Miltoncostaeaceae bacterium]|nr:class I SAM-dependent methyltransferase [Miltoncostaeaceae bacterium]